MNILIITSSYPAFPADATAAAGLFVRDFACELVRQGHRVVVQPVGKKHSYQADPGLIIEPLPWEGGDRELASMNMYNPLLWSTYVKFFIQGRAKAVETAKRYDINQVLCMWAVPSGIFGHWIKAQLGIPYDVWALGSDVWKIKTLPYAGVHLLRTVFASARHVFADGPKLCEDVRVISRRPCLYLPSSRRLAGARASNIPELSTDVRHLLFVGRYHWNKAPDLLVEAIGMLPEEDRRRIHVHMFGFGPLEGKLLERIAQLKLNSSISLQGPIDEHTFAGYLSKVSYLVIPSRIESIPVVLSDALQKGVPVIAAPAGDLPQWIEQHQCGILSKSSDPADLCDAIQKALRLSPEHFRDGVRKAAEHFKIDRTVKAWSGSRAAQQLAPAVIFSGGSEALALSIAEELAGFNVPLIVISAVKKSLIRDLPGVRLYREITWPPNERTLDQLKDIFDKFGAGTSAPLPVFASEDSGLRFLLEHREALQKYLIIPNARRLRLAGLDKAEFFEFLRKSDLRQDIPMTTTLRNPADLKTAAEVCPRGFVIKPSLKPYDMNLKLAVYGQKAVDCSVGENNSLLAELCKGPSAWIAQERLDIDQGEAKWWGLRLKDGRTVGMTAMALWKQPRFGGTTCYAQSCPVPGLDVQAGRILSTIDYHGIVELEFLKDNNGGWKLIELNPRPWLQVSLAGASGLPVLYWSYLDSVGENVPADSYTIMNGRHWVNVERILWSAVSGEQGSRWTNLSKATHAIMHSDRVAVYDYPSAVIRSRWILKMLGICFKKVVGAQKVRHAVSHVLIGVSIVWLGGMVYQDRSFIAQLMSSMRGKDLGWLLLSCLLGAGSVFMNSYSFKALFDLTTGRSAAAGEIRNVFFQSQIVRYLPLRFIGMMYQASAIKSGSAHAVVTANLHWLLTTMVFNALVVVVLTAGFFDGLGVGLTAGVLGLVLFWCYLRLTVFQKMISTMIRWLRLPQNPGEDMLRCSPAKAAEITAVYSASWFFYLAAWECFRYIADGFSHYDMMLLCAFYTLACIVGIISMITPGGLGVREGVFYWLVAQWSVYPGLSFLMVFFRIWLMAVDVLAVAINAVFRSIMPALSVSGKTRSASDFASMDQL